MFDNYGDEKPVAVFSKSNDLLQLLTAAIKSAETLQQRARHKYIMTVKREGVRREVKLRNIFGWFRTDKIPLSFKQTQLVLERRMETAPWDAFDLWRGMQPSIGKTGKEMAEQILHAFANDAQEVFISVSDYKSLHNLAGMK